MTFRSERVKYFPTDKQIKLTINNTIKQLMKKNKNTYLHNSINKIY